MNVSKEQNESSFQNAIATVEALSTEKQTLLIDTIQKRLQQKNNNAKESNIENSEGYKAYVANARLDKQSLAQIIKQYLITV